VVTFIHPIWLILAIPLLAGWWVYRPLSRFLHFTRLAIIILILLAISGLAIRLPSRDGTLVLIADRSLSMPEGSEGSQKEAIDLIQRAMSDQDRLAVLSLGQKAVLERSPQTGAFSGFTNRVEPDGSNLADAVEKAVALIPQNTTGKILIISDGRWTGEDPSGSAAKAVRRGIAIDYRLSERTTANDLALAQIDAPISVSPGEAFMIGAWVKSPLRQEIKYELRRGNEVLAAGTTEVSSGLSRIGFRDHAGDLGAQGYTLKITNQANDPLPENNTAKILVGVQGPRPLLIVTNSPGSGLAELLAKGGLKINPRMAEQVDWSIDTLAQYSAVLMENVPAQKIGEQGMETIASWITETGGGMVMTGGKNAYGPGGYFKSPLEELMPVSMELRMEHRKFSLAIAVVMDRSGSMAVEVGGGRSKMDLANLAAVTVLDLLSPTDEFGVIAVDSSSHTILDLNTVDVNARHRQKILQVDSMGGGIFIYEGLTAGAEMMLKAKAGSRHIILFADAADSEEPGKYQELLARCQEAGITVSVIGLGKPSDIDANLLRDIANRGKGQIFFTENASELPRLFAQDTIVVARNTFLEDPAQIQFTSGIVMLAGKQFTSPPRIGGYNLTYLRPKANLAAVTTDDYQAPVVAAWQAGSGRVLCYTGEADGKFTGAIAGWSDVGDLFSSLARWTAGDGNTLDGNMLLTQEVNNGISVIKLHLDPERDQQESGASSIISALPKVTTLRGVPGAKPTSEKAEMRWTSADTLEYAYPLKGNETALSAVEVAGGARLTLAPVTLPYSPEYKPVDVGEGRAALARLAQITGGQERIELAGVWKDMPRRARLIELAPWFLLPALILLLAEIFERRTGLITSRMRIKQKERRQRIKTVKQEISPHYISEAPQTISDVKTPETSPQKAEQPEPVSIINALQQARRQAKERTDSNQGIRNKRK